MDSHRRVVILGRFAAVAVLVLTGLLAIFTWSGGVFLPVGVILAAVLLKWPSNRPALIVTALVSGLFVLQFAILLPQAVADEDYRELVPSGLALLLTSAAVAVSSITAFVIRVRQPSPQTGW